MYRGFTWSRDGQRWKQIQTVRKTTSKVRVKREHTENKHEEREHTQKYTRVWRITKARREDNKTWNNRRNNENIRGQSGTWQIRVTPPDVSFFQKEVWIFCRWFLCCFAVRLPRQSAFPHFYFHFPFNSVQLCAGVALPICQPRPSSWFCNGTQKTLVLKLLSKLVFLYREREREMR